MTTMLSNVEKRTTGSQASLPEGIRQNCACSKEDHEQNCQINNGAAIQPCIEIPESTGPLVAESWKYPRSNLLRYLATLFSLFMMGVHDASIGALLPYIEEYYNINYTIVATMFLTQVTGYTISAILINKVHMRFGQLGIAIIGPSFKIFTYVVTCLHPPFPVIPIVFALAGFGNGLMDGAWNAWVGGLAHPNELLGLLHGAYGLGATVAPLISTSMVTTGGLKWYTFYYIVVGGAVSELIFATFAFRTATGAKFCLLHPAQLNAKSRTHEALSYKLTWLLSIFLLIYVGTEVSIGGWIVTFMLEIRHGPAFSSGMVATGFWLGLTLGRVILGFITGRIGEKLAITIYLILAVALELVFWLVKSFVTSAVMIAFVGFCLGPVFPAVIVVVTKALPEHLHVSVIGFVAAVGMAGAALIPFATGAIGQATGVGVLGPIALGLIAGILVLWVCLPGGFKDKLDRKVERTPGQQEV